MSINQDSTALIVRNFELETDTSTVNEEELLRLLTERIAYMIEHKLDFLLSLLYRLDVDEGKINFALSPLAPDPPAVGLAKLVMERQRQRLATKEKYRQKDSDEWDW